MENHKGCVEILQAAEKRLKLPGTNNNTNADEVARLQKQVSELKMTVEGYQEAETKNTDEVARLQKENSELKLTLAAYQEAGSKDTKLEQRYQAGFKDGFEARLQAGQGK